MSHAGSGSRLLTSLESHHYAGRCRGRKGKSITVTRGNSAARAASQHRRQETSTYPPLHSLIHALIIPDQYVVCMRRFLVAHILTATSQNMARQAAIKFGQSDALNGTEGAGISHEMDTGSPSVVVSTTSSHVRPQGVEDDPQDMELLTKPRGFFADQFEVRRRARRGSTWQYRRYSLGRRCRTGATLMHTTKGLAQRFGDKRTASWTRSSRVRVSPSW